jgi:hypothetical protein
MIISRGDPALILQTAEHSFDRCGCLSSDGMCNTLRVPVDGDQGFRLNVIMISGAT